MTEYLELSDIPTAELKRIITGYEDFVKTFAPLLTKSLNVISDTVHRLARYEEFNFEPMEYIDIREDFNGELNDITYTIYTDINDTLIISSELMVYLGNMAEPFELDIEDFQTEYSNRLDK